MEAVLRLVESATGSPLRWRSRGFYATVECIDDLPCRFRDRLVAACQPDGSPFSWQRMHVAMDLFSQLARETGLIDRDDYPAESDRRIPAYARDVQRFAPHPT
jgi:hypothetical protein